MVSPYQVLAVRHRPRKLEDIVGQDTAVKVVRGFMKSGKVPQTILISGVYSSGKTTLSRIIARYIYCQNPVKVDGFAIGEPCGKCWSCLELDKVDHNHPDVHEVNAAEERGIDAVRGWIEQARYKPQSNYRIFIIDESHALTGEGMQAFLKPLEEPSKSTVWILCTTELSRIIHTIRSRAMPVKLNEVSVEDCVDLLETVCGKEGHVVPRAALQKVAAAAGGHPREALQVLESVVNVLSVLDKSDNNLDQIITETAAEVVGEPPEVAARKYLFGVYWGKYTIPLSVIQTVSNPAIFVDAIMRLHSHTIRYVVSKKLWDKYYMDYYSKLEADGLCCKDNFSKYPKDDKHMLLQTGPLSHLTETFFQALTQLKQYYVDPVFVLQNMTCKAILEMKDTNTNIQLGESVPREQGPTS